MRTHYACEAAGVRDVVLTRSLYNSTPILFHSIAQVWPSGRALALTGRRQIMKFKYRISTGFGGLMGRVLVLHLCDPGSNPMIGSYFFFFSFFFFFFFFFFACHQFVTIWSCKGFKLIKEALYTHV